MTIVEFFDKSPIDNVISTLVLDPERILFIGDSKDIHRGKVFYERFFKAIGRRTEVVTAPVNKRHLAMIVDVLTTIVQTEEDCIFDLTGGDELVLAGMGIVYERFRESGRVRMHRFNTHTGTARDVVANVPVTAYPKPTLTVAQSVMLYGGVVGGSADGDDLTTWDFTPSFSCAIDAMWSVCRQDPARWNGAVAALSELGKYSLADGDPLRTTVELHRLADVIDGFDKKYSRAVWLLRELASAGVITLQDEEERLRYTVADTQIRRCLSKAGNLLEVRILRLIRKLRTADGGESFFDDSQNGVFIDWDGTFDDMPGRPHDTLNEIDVLAMRGVTPVFISCKNGKVDDGELYKLNTVAQRFGGPRAVKLIVATYIDTDDCARAYVLQRAEDMGITVLADVHRKSDEELAKAIRHRCL